MTERLGSPLSGLILQNFGSCHKPGSKFLSASIIF